PKPMKSLNLISRAMALVVVLLVVSCKSKPELVTYIPKDADLVMTFDVKSMAYKSLDFKQLFSFDNIKKAIGSIGEKKDTTSAAIKDTGIDLVGKAYLFAEITKDASYGAVLARLSDAKQFEAFLKKTDPGLTVADEAGMKSAPFSNGKGL